MSKATDCGHHASDGAAEHRHAEARQRAIIGERLGKPQGNAGPQ
ncbi:MAG TPA: hypothetical protein VGL34_23795 [Steroidobacteraceae bacterium]